jgi:hypothetical protein
MARMLLRVGALCCWVAFSPSFAQQPSVQAPLDGTSMQGPTLRTLAPGLSATTGSGNPSYAALVRTALAVGAPHGARIERFTAPDGRLVTVSIAAPSVEKAFEVPPIQPGENPAVYFANAVKQATQHTESGPGGPADGVHISRHLAIRYKTQAGHHFFL